MYQSQAASVRALMGCRGRGHRVAFLRFRERNSEISLVLKNNNTQSEDVPILFTYETMSRTPENIESIGHLQLSVRAGLGMR